MLSVAAEARHGRTARAADRRGEALGARKIEPLYLIPARDPLEIRRRDDEVRRVPAPRGLTTAGAVAVRESDKWGPDTVANRATETASLKYFISHG